MYTTPEPDLAAADDVAGHDIGPMLGVLFHLPGVPLHLRPGRPPSLPG